MAEEPFFPAMTGGTVGLTQSIVLTSGAPAAGTCTIASGPLISTILVSNTATLAAFVRISTTPSLTATTVDIPVMPTSNRIFGAPSGLAIYCYAANAQTLAANSTVYFTPGEGGVAQ